MGAIVKFSSSPVYTADLVPGDLVMSFVDSSIIKLVLAVRVTKTLSAFTRKDDDVNNRTNYVHDVVLNKLGTTEINTVAYSGYWQWERL